MLIVADFKPINTGAPVYYTVVGVQSRTAVGVSELIAGTGQFGVDVAPSLISGNAVLWDIDGTTMTATETFPIMAPDSSAIQAAATAALNAYDPPTRTEATQDKDAVILAVNAVAATVISGVPQANIATASTLNTGTLIAGTYADTFLDNSVYLVTAPVSAPVNGFTLNREMVFGIGSAAPQSVSVNGRFTAGTTRAAACYIWNYTGTPAWDLLANINMVNSATDANYTATILPAHVQNGEVKLRFTATSTTTGDRLFLDQVVVNAVSASPTAEQTAEAVYLRMKNTVYESAVWVDTIGGTAGTTVGTHGLPNNPVSNLADALTIATSLGVKHLSFYPDSTVTLTSNMDYWTFDGHAYIDLGGQSISDAQFLDAHISGLSLGADARFHNCEFGDATLGEFTAYSSALGGTITLGAGSSTLVACVSNIPGTATPTFIFSDNAYVGIRNYSGGIQFNEMDITNRASLEGQGQLKIDSTCTGGVIAVRGCFSLTDNVVGGFTGTLSDSARFAEDQSTVSSNMVAEAPTASQNATAVRGELTLELGRIDSNVSAAKTLISAYDNAKADVLTPLGGVRTTVDGISNVTRISSSLPRYISVPEVTKAVLIECAYKDYTGAMDDPDDNILGLSMYSSDGFPNYDTYLYSDAALTQQLEFDAGIGSYKMVKDSTGLYYCYLKVEPAFTEEEVTARFTWRENTALVFEMRDTQIANFNGELGSIAQQITNLKDFDPANDVVAHVTLVDTVTTITEDVAAQVDFSGVETLINGLNDFDPANDVVAHVTLADTVTTVTEDVAAQVDLSPVTDMIGLLNDFDPATDAVAHVTLVDTVTTVTEDVAAQVDLTPVTTLIDGLNDFDPANDVVARVTLVDTVTTVTEDVAAQIDLTPVTTLIDGLNNFDPANDTVAHVTLVDTVTEITEDLSVDLSPITSLLPATVIASQVDVQSVPDGVWEYDLDGAPASYRVLTTDYEIGGIVSGTATALNEAVAAAVWSTTQRTLSEFGFDVVDEPAMGQEVIAQIMAVIGTSQFLEPGPGLGSIRFEDTLTGSGDAPVRGAVVRAFPVADGLTDWTDLKGSCTTSSSGRYHLYLDPGTYARRIWKNGTVVLDDRITIVEP